MWWVISVSAVAILILFYITGKRAIARDKAIATGNSGTGRGQNSTPKLAKDVSSPQQSGSVIDTQDVIFYANTFHGNITNDGLDTLLSNMDARELSLGEMCQALKAVGADEVVPFLNQASLEYARYAQESDVLTAPEGSTEQQAHVKAYLGRMGDLETAIDKLDIDVAQLARTYARDHGLD